MTRRRGRVLLLTALFVLVAFAGCVAPGADVDPAAELPAATGLQVKDAPALVHVAGDALSGQAALEVEATSLYIGHDAAEPTLGVTSEGVLFYAAATFKNDVAGQPFPLPRTDILRSVDSGRTWEDVTPYLPGGVVRAHPETGDPYVYVDPATDRVFDIDQRMAVGSYTVSFSDDDGESWTGPFVACDAPPCDHQTIVASKPRALPTAGYPSIVMVCYNQVHSVACQRSLTGGAGFERATPPFRGIDENGFCGGLHGHLKASADGVIYLPKDHCGIPMVAVTKDDGVTWTVSTVSDLPAGGGPDPVIATDAEGNVYYAWINPDDGHLSMSTSTDQGATWSEAVDLTPPGVTAAHLPAIAAGDAGQVVLAYTATDDPEGFEGDVDPDQRNATWHGYLSLVQDALSPKPAVLTVRVNPADDPLVRGYCGPGRCPGMYDFIDVIVDAQGRPWAAFVDACTEDCARDPKEKNNAREGFVATLGRGPSLRAGMAPLPALPPAAPPA